MTGTIWNVPGVIAQLSTQVERAAGDVITGEVAGVGSVTVTIGLPA